MVEPPEDQDSVAQLVEQYTFNVWVLGSSPSGITMNASESIFRGIFISGITGAVTGNIGWMWFKEVKIHP